MNIHDERDTVSNIELDDMIGRKNFIVVVPEYTFELIEHIGDEEFMETLVER